MGMDALQEKLNLAALRTKALVRAMRALTTSNIRLQSQARSWKRRFQSATECGELPVFVSQISQAYSEDETLGGRAALVAFLKDVGRNLTAQSKAGYQYSATSKDALRPLLAWGGARVITFLHLNFLTPGIKSMRRWCNVDKFDPGINESTFLQVKAALEQSMQNHQIQAPIP